MSTPEDPRTKTRPLRRSGTKAENPLLILAEVAILDELGTQYFVEMTMSEYIRGLDQRVGVLASLTEDARVWGREEADG